jgi:hypothetical protein
MDIVHQSTFHINQFFNPFVCRRYCGTPTKHIGLGMEGILQEKQGTTQGSQDRSIQEELS